MAEYTPYPDTRRRTGRTTVLALEYTAKALSHPGTPVRVHDHHDGPHADRHLLHAIVEIVDKMGWTGYLFDMNRRTVTFGAQ
jgi:hypothetical protein